MGSMEGGTRKGKKKGISDGIASLSLEGMFGTFGADNAAANDVNVSSGYAAADNDDIKRTNAGLAPSFLRTTNAPSSANSPRPCSTNGAFLARCTNGIFVHRRQHT